MRNNSNPKVGSNAHVNLTLQAAINASRPAFIAIGGFSFFINLLMLTGPIFMLQIYDRVLSSRSLPTLAVLFALVAGLFLVLGILEFIRTRVLARIGVHISQRIRERLFDAVMQLGLKTGGSERSTSMLRELDIVKQYLSGPGFVVLFDAPWVPVYIGVIFLFHPTLGWLAVLAAIFLFIIALLNDIRSKKPSKNIAKATNETSKIAEIGRRNGEALAAMGMFRSLRTLWSKKHDDLLIGQTVASDRQGSLSAISNRFVYSYNRLCWRRALYLLFMEKFRLVL